MKIRFIKLSLIYKKIFIFYTKSTIKNSFLKFLKFNQLNDIGNKIKKN